MAGRVRTTVDAACSRCGHVLYDDPETWPHPPGKVTAVTSPTEGWAALADLEATYYPGRVTHEGRSGGLSRPGVVIELEQTEGEQRLRFVRHPGCDRRPFVIRWDALSRKAIDARQRGQSRFLI